MVLNQRIVALKEPRAYKSHLGVCKRARREEQTGGGRRGGESKRRMKVEKKEGAIRTKRFPLPVPRYPHVAFMKAGASRVKGKKREGECERARPTKTGP